MTDIPVPPPTPDFAGLPPANVGGQAGPPPAAMPWYPAPVPPEPRKRSYKVLAIVMAVFLGISFLGNIALILATLGLAGMVVTGDEESFVEKVVEKGPATQKIAVIHINGVIMEEMALTVRGEIERAARDSSVKAVIIRINSPGGGLTASDMIYHDIKSLLIDQGKPVIAAMDSVAASGGYYVACSANEIVAQPTTITGSIGVIAQFFYINGLLKDKLGVTTVTLTKGKQKDWPNLFAADMTDEQKTYFLDVLLQPGYDRFIDIVAESRKLAREDVHTQLATGRIFMAKEAKEKGLIDTIGYFDQAVDVAKKRAGITTARVVEYSRPFRLADLVGMEARSRVLFDLKPERLAELGAPKIMYLWTGN
jgi:protease IV